MDDGYGSMQGDYTGMREVDGEHLLGDPAYECLCVTHTIPSSNVDGYGSGYRDSSGCPVHDESLWVECPECGNMIDGIEGCQECRLDWQARTEIDI